MYKYRYLNTQLYLASGLVITSLVLSLGTVVFVWKILGREGENSGFGEGPWHAWVPRFVALALTAPTRVANQEPRVLNKTPTEDFNINLRQVFQRLCEIFGNFFSVRASPTE